MADILNDPMGTIRKVFRKDMPDVSVADILSPIEPGDKFIAYANGDMQLFLEQFHFVQRIPVEGNAEIPSIEFNPSEEKVRICLWDRIPRAAKKDMLIELLRRLTWECATTSIPGMMDHVGEFTVKAGYQIVVQQPYVEIVPGCGNPESRLHEFIPKLRDIFLGKCIFDGSPGSIAPPGSVRIGRVQSEFLKQVVILSSKMTKKALEAYPDLSVNEVHVRFARKSYMDYLRHVKWSGWTVHQLGLMQQLVTLAITQEDLELVPPQVDLSSVGNMKTITTMITVDKEWNIIQLPSMI